ncbi:hypothetical protein [uncultured Desulfosarcina sp.]|uniref:hypothetical protein n=1 Tax=uncultured Desulfosarcina sp. TaxID=218289 RepID=UPI0029C7BC6B|nr:hypothetical protein [uncultured Desulfosarcina sp.]
MTHDRKRYAILERVFRDVYRKSPDQGTGSMDPVWRANVLRRIRKSEPNLGEFSPLMWLFQRYLWRLAPVAGVFIVLMGVWIFLSGISPDMEIAALAMDNPVSYSLIQPFEL